MKREIKFRTYVPESNQMVYCDYGIEYSNAIYYTGSQYIEGTSEKFPVDAAKECYVMQFTGLHDKNGKDIYEGDILKKDDFICPVEYFTPYAAFVAVEGNFMMDLNDDNDFEVIGNIHENPELLQP